MEISRMQAEKLRKALSYLTDVQIELLQQEEKKPASERDERWRVLYRLRCGLNDFRYEHKINN